jgi:hypothetical protein
MKAIEEMKVWLGNTMKFTTMAIFAHPPKM